MGSKTIESPTKIKYGEKHMKNRHVIRYTREDFTESARRGFLRYQFRWVVPEDLKKQGFDPSKALFDPAPEYLTENFALWEFLTKDGGLIQVMW